MLVAFQEPEIQLAAVLSLLKPHPPYFCAAFGTIFGTNIHGLFMLSAGLLENVSKKLIQEFQKGLPTDENGVPMHWSSHYCVQQKS